MVDSAIRPTSVAAPTRTPLAWYASRERLHGKLRDDDGGNGVDGDELRLTMPAAGPYTRLARVAVTGLATRLGFSFEEVDDLRVAVADVCTKLIALVPDADHLDVTFVVGDSHLAIDIGINGSDAEGPLSDAAERPGDGGGDQIEYLEDRRVIRVTKTHVEDD
jgi:hypothetical protein